VIYDSGLSYEEVYRLYQIAERTGHATATSTLHVEGTSAANLIGATLRFADRELGDEVFGARGSVPPELDDLLRLSSESLAARVERHLAEANAVVSIEFTFPEFSRKAKVLECVRTPIKVHFIPFFGNPHSPRFGVEDRRVGVMFPEELARIREMAEHPAKLFERSPHLARAQRYAATLSLLNRAVRSNRIEVENLAEYRQMFDRNRSVITALPGRLLPLIGKCDFGLLKERLSQAKDASVLLRTVGAGFVYVLGRNPSEMCHLEDVVRGHLVRLAPPVTEATSEAERYLRRLAGSLGLAAHSAHLPIGISQGDGPRSLRSGMTELVMLLSKQDIDGAFECLARMPFTPDPFGKDNSVEAQVALPRALIELIGLGYGADLRELLLKRIAAMGAQDMGSLAAVAPGVLVALGYCFKQTLSDPIPYEGLEDSALTRSRGSFVETYLRVALSALAFPARVVDGHRVPTLAVLEHRVLSLRMTQVLDKIGLQASDFEILKDFVEKVVQHTTQYDPTPVKNQVKPITAGRYGSGVQIPELSGELRLQSEGAVRVVLGMMSSKQVEETSTSYRRLINECAESIRDRLGNNPLAPAVLVEASEYFFRVKRRTLGNVGTLIDAVQQGKFDCDASCHIFADVLRRFGINSEIALTSGHAHLHVNGIHFEARGGILQRQELAVLNYGAMTFVSAHDVAYSVGTVEALVELIAPANKGDFLLYLLEGTGPGECRPGPIPLARRLSLTEAQVDGVSRLVQTALAMLPTISYTVGKCFETIEILASHGYLEGRRLNELRHKLLNELTHIPHATLYTKFSRKVLGLPDELSSTEHTTQRGRSKSGPEWLVDEAIHDPALKDQLPWKAAATLAEIRAASVRLLETGQQLSEAQRKAVQDLNMRFLGYEELLAQSDLLPDREYFFVSKAWMLSPSPENHAAAMQDLYYMKHRPQDARNWAWTLPQHRSENLAHAAAVWRALAQLGDEKGMEDHLGRLPGTMRLQAAGPYWEYLQQAQSKDGVRHKERFCFARGGFETISGTRYFLDRGRALGYYDEDTHRHYVAELEERGPSLELAMEIANASTHVQDAFCFILRFHEERDFRKLRLAYSFVKPSLGTDRITLALELRESGNYDALKELCRVRLPEMTQQVRELFVGPWLAVSREIEWLSQGAGENRESLKELFVTKGIKDPFAAQYLAEAEATHYLSRQDCDLRKARELLAGLTVTPMFDPVAFRSMVSMVLKRPPRRYTRFHLVLQRMLLEKQYDALKAQAEEDSFPGRGVSTLGHQSYGW
jgi:hypothetical protein